MRFNKWRSEKLKMVKNVHFEMRTYIYNAFPSIGSARILCACCSSYLSPFAFVSFIFFKSTVFPQTGLSCRGPGGELEAGRRCTGRRTILHARFVCVFTVFERSRFTTLQRNGGYPHELRARSVKMALVPSKPHLAPSRQPISKMTQKTLFSQNCPGTFGVSFAIITGT